jgi:hypothetical protein
MGCCPNSARPVRIAVTVHDNKTRRDVATLRVIFSPGAFRDTIAMRLLQPFASSGDRHAVLHAGLVQTVLACRSSMISERKNHASQR